MNSFMLSCKLYDWSLSEREEDFGSRHETECILSVSPEDTQSALIRLHRDNPGKKICWLNMANAHNTLGTYNNAWGGSQEEEVAPNSSAAVTLGLHADRVTSSFRVFVQREHHIVYKKGWHIPPGGNYFAKTRFITADPQVDCYMVATAFADFRAWIPGFRYNTERSDYYGLFGGLKDRTKLNERLKLDMEGLLKTCSKEGMDILVLSASGCGAFRHDPWVEAPLWRECLDKYRHHFEQVVFAILPDPRSPDNVTAFETHILPKVESASHLDKEERDA
eukprot:TRINITY_DN14950_c0_g1_i1.p1 TRINITY_DN14950_c0_g1~~TRINITY_DN14950_c0_g1_i1.p1  ORF type:complete len:278 (-),score=52.08 TRINITY_DN14950_c0_g1_i1:78-911(-)